MLGRLLQVRWLRQAPLKITMDLNSSVCKKPQGTMTTWQQRVVMILPPKMPSLRAQSGTSKRPTPKRRLRHFQPLQWAVFDTTDTWRYRSRGRALYTGRSSHKYTSLPHTATSGQSLSSRCAPPESVVGRSTLTTAHAKFRTGTYIARET